MRPPGNHIVAALLRGITDQAGLDPVDRKKPILVIETIVSNDWASATFVGARHQLDLRLDGAPAAVATALAALVAGLPELEFAIAGHIVAEINVEAGLCARIAESMVKQSLTVNVLTIID